MMRHGLGLLLLVGVEDQRTEQVDGEHTVTYQLQEYVAFSLEGEKKYNFTMRTSCNVFSWKFSHFKWDTVHKHDNVSNNLLCPSYFKMVPSCQQGSTLRKIMNLIHLYEDREHTDKSPFSGKLSNEEIRPVQYRDLSFGILHTLTGKIPSDAELDKMKDNQVEDLYWSYLNTIQVLCQRIVRVGKIEDGGKEVCADDPFRPRSPCLVYSFGINYQWDFDDDAARMFGCEVFTFDPSMRDKGESYKYAKDFTFYMIGLGAKNEILQNLWRMRTLEQIRRDLNHTERTINILKIDIEGSEWTSIAQMVPSGTLHTVKQMQIELHGNGTKYNMKVLRMLYEDGFRIFMRDRNINCKYSRAGIVRQRTSCMEVSMIRVSS